MEPSIQETKIISYTRKTNDVHFNYYVRDVLILRSVSTKYLGVMFDSKLYFHSNVDFAYYQAHRTLRLIRYIVYNFSSLDSLLVSYSVLISYSMLLSHEITSP
jgi:hypothetical protein